MAEDEKIEKTKTTTLPVLFLCNAFTSSTLTLLNKRTAISITCPWLVVLLQCFGATLIALIMNLRVRSIRRIQLKQLPGLLLISCMFTLCLVSSIRGLRRVHVPMAVVGKNLTPFITAILERFLLRCPLSSSTVVSLLIGSSGGGIYLLGDSNATREGLFYVVINAACVSLTAIAEKKVVKEKKQSPLGLSMMRNALAIPFVSLFLITDIEATQQAWREVMSADWAAWTGMMLTSLFSAVSGTLVFQLQTMVTATTLQVATLFYKLVSTFLSFFLFPSSRADIGLVAALGYALSMASISLYVLSPK